MNVGRSLKRADGVATRCDLIDGELRSINCGVCVGHVASKRSLVWANP